MTIISRVISYFFEALLIFSWIGKTCMCNYHRKKQPIRQNFLYRPCSYLLSATVYFDITMGSLELLQLLCIIRTTRSDLIGQWQQKAPVGPTRTLTAAGKLKAPTGVLLKNNNWLNEIHQFYNCAMSFIQLLFYLQG